MSKAFDGSFGTWQYRAGGPAGVFSLFQNRKFFTAMTNRVLNSLIRASRKGVRITRRLVRQEIRRDAEPVRAGRS